MTKNKGFMMLKNPQSFDKSDLVLGMWNHIIKDKVAPVPFVVIGISEKGIHGTMNASFVTPKYAALQGKFEAFMDEIDKMLDDPNYLKDLSEMKKYE